MDRISELPDEVVHKIMSSFDCYTDLVRNSILSKRWFALLASFPILDFCEHPRSLNLGENCKRENFINHIEYMLSQFSGQNLIAFRLGSFFGDSVDFSLIDKWIETVLDKGVCYLELKDLRFIELMGLEEYLLLCKNKYQLPDKIFSSKSLTSLTIYHCELPWLVPDGVKCNCLKVLYLNRVKLDENVIRCFICSCPLIGTFEISLCYGFKVLSIHGLENLQVAGCDYLDEVERIYIQGPNVEFVWLTSYETNTTEPDINLELCKKLKRLSLEIQFQMTWLSELLSKFPALEDVSLKNRCFLEKSFQVSSHSLRKFELHLRGSQNLERIAIDAPSLRLFRFCGDLDPLLLFSLTSIWAKCICCMHWDIESSGLWFNDLRELLDTTKQFIVLELHIPVQNVRFEDLNAIRSQPPHEIEHLELKMKDMSYGFIDVIEAVFASCHPQSLTLIWNHEISVFEGNKSFVECLHLKLIEQLDGGQEELQMVVGGGSTFEREFLSMKVLLDALSSVEVGQEITFRKAN